RTISRELRTRHDLQFSSALSRFRTGGQVFLAQTLRLHGIGTQNRNPVDFSNRDLENTNNVIAERISLTIERPFYVHRSIDLRRPERLRRRVASRDWRYCLVEQ